MGQSLGLAAYRAYVRRSQPEPYVATTQRPKGELLWIHAAEQGSLPTVLDLARRLIAHRYGLHVLITCAAKTDMTCNGITVSAPPGEHPSDVDAFLDHWGPDAGLWLWGDLQPNLILKTAEKRIPLYLANAGQEGFDNRRERWLPEVARDVLTHFERILVRSDAAMARLSKLGRNLDALEQTAPLMPGGQALPYVHSDFVDLGQVLAGRPLWFAASVQPTEVSVVLAAHRRALRLSHRLLLVLNPGSEAQTEECLRQLSAEGLRTARWEDGDMPDDNCQVLLASAQDELGLWYRIAPLSFLGSSLSSGHGGLDPYEAAALGSAILYGPNVGRHLASYSRLAAAGAGRIVNDANALGAAVSQLISPDHAASMAMAGWDVISQGAAVSDRVMELIQAALDAREEGTA
jgi:3-deoxy-D-manno-octulosonic-acid transferase